MSPPSQAQALPARRSPDDEADLLSALMQRYAEGNDTAFGRLYQSLAPRLYRFCKRLTRHPSEADDVFQESFLRLHRARATYMSGLDVLHWTFAIARSAYLDRLRYWRRRPESLGSANDTAQDEHLRADEQYAPEAQVAAHDLVQIVTAELDKMSEKNRVAYILLEEEGLSINEAAHPPALNGQHFHYVAAPNRAGLPAHYELHVWAWTRNPNGTFADWNPRVRCDSYQLPQ